MNNIKKMIKKELEENDKEKLTDLVKDEVKKQINDKSAYFSY